MTKQILFFAHANGFPSASYRAMFEPLAAHYRIEAPEKLGHHPDYPVNDNWRNLSSELLSVLDQTTDEPVIGVGHSLGAVVMFLAAHRRPEGFHAVVMLDPPAYFGWTSLAMRVLKRTPWIDKLTPAGKTRFRRTRWPSRQAAFDALKTKGLFRRFDPDCLWDYINAGTRDTEHGVELIYDPAVETRIFQSIPDDLPTLPTPLAVPGRIIIGDESDVVRPSDIRRLARRHHMGVQTIPGGHMFPFETPGETATWVHEAIQALIGGASG